MRLAAGRTCFWFSIVAILIGTALTVGANGVTIEARNDGSRIVWATSTSFQNATLTVGLPNGTVAERTFAGEQVISFSPLDLEQIEAADGLYTWQIVLSPVVSQETRRILDEARENGDFTVVESLRQRGELPAEEDLIQSGSFRIVGRSLASDEVVETRSDIDVTKGSEAPIDMDDPTRAQVIVTDLVVQGSECVGFDCVNGESFGFDTLRLKENNLRIHFQDTSVSASFPTNDWRIVANDTTNGGANYLAVEDSNTGRQVFKVTAGAPASSLLIDSGGDVGLGTSNPVVQLHIADGNTPTMRLEQNGTSGWTPQTWDVAGNEANFFIRDATNGSNLPFRIRPSAPTSSIDIASNGSVGLGTSSPSFAVHSYRSNANVAYVGQRGDGATVFMNATSDFGQFGTTTTHPLRLLVDTITQMTLNTDGSLTMANGATCSAAGEWNDASSRDLKDEIRDLSSSDAREVLDGLEPVTFRYRRDQTVEQVGFIAEDVPDLVATKDRKSLGAMDVVAVLTKVVQDQQGVIEELQDRLDELEKQNEILE